MGSAIISNRKDKKLKVKSLSTVELKNKLSTCKKKHKSKIEKELAYRE